MRCERRQPGGSLRHDCIMTSSAMPLPNALNPAFRINYDQNQSGDDGMHPPASRLQNVAYDRVADEHADGCGADHRWAS